MKKKVAMKAFAQIAIVALLSGCGLDTSRLSRALTGETGYIEPPATGDGGSDTGTISPTGTVTIPTDPGTLNPDPTQNPITDTTSPTDPGTTTPPSGTTDPTPPTTDPTNPDSGSTTPPSTTAPGGTDGGSIDPSTGPDGSGDGGSVTGPGTQPTPPDDGTVTDPGGSTTPPGDSTTPPGDTTTPPTDGGSTAPGGTTPGGDDGGSIPGGSTDPGTDDGGEVPGGSTDPGTDGGSTPPGDTDGGYCAQNEETVKFKLNAVKGKEDGIHLADAVTPILAIEARVPAGDTSKNPMSMYKNGNSAVGPEYYEWMQSVPSVLLLTIDLTQTSLFGPKFPAELTISYDDLDWEAMATEIPKGWQKVLVTFYVCDDTNHNGQCSDEVFAKQVLLNPPTHKACQLPSAVVAPIRK